MASFTVYHDNKYYYIGGMDYAFKASLKVADILGYDEINFKDFVAKEIRRSITVYDEYLDCVNGFTRTHELPQNLTKLDNIVLCTLPNDKVDFFIDEDGEIVTRFYKED